jgi:hypothetical protein
MWKIEMDRPIRIIFMDIVTTKLQKISIPNDKAGKFLSSSAKDQ